ncbi:MAG: FHA domain-containing protein [Cetobacterium sp.]
MNIFREWKLKQELKKHHKRQLKMAQESQRDGIVFYIFSLSLILAWGAYYLGYRFKIDDLPIIGMILLVITNLFLWISNYKLKKDIFLYQKGEGLREAKMLQSIEDKSYEKKKQLTHIILKNEEGYDVKTWSIGKANSLIIGKSSRVRVDIDLTEASYSSLISKNHAILNKTDNGWFLEDLGSVNGTGIQKLSDNRKLKVKTGPVKVESGDIIYIATTALLIR